ncbi:sigma 54-interacting transcriptional regulator [Rhodoplanes sp. TEM]|uniref:HTH-type transcriptional regulatory protein TyrR n=1 Tax=Rhodoplanes tepidamans TaxID=200616 RepID=A0ABT5JEA6_RHOTP|nr:MULTISPECIES: sigma 54-interacting transcriptional regulator [Rhodoplanes]MDC7787609.1 sigma 54-interacting transcriptional regulator [Rhodoplanes tepidamans]MDC7988029.1 sigma 54-interacting transcriptional regulator [Rhodoplanes sp. TEM]MDQ0358037.1 PAS domain S-box-containing protein [Rhodoplanes tepidamans]
MPVPGETDAAAILDGLIDTIAAGGAAALEPVALRRDLEAVRDALRRARELDFREIGDHLYDGIYIADGSGRTLWVNRAYTRITGIAAEEIVGRNVEDLLEAGLYRNAVTPEVIRRRRQVNAVGESVRNGTKMLISGNPLLDRAGQVKMVVVVDREITDLSAMQAELEATQEKMKAVADATVKTSREIEHLRRQAPNRSLLGRSDAIRTVLTQIEQVADLDVTVLIGGETGVGKEVVADEIHRRGSRRARPFIKVNCAAIPASLLESELFGHEKGAFTGASGSGRMGLFELADKGTLLLDEIGEMPIELQAKLLRAIQHKEITRVGGTRRHRLDVRILASTNRDLRDLARQGRFREDLFYRLDVFPIVLPPLRGRPEDVEVLAGHFLAAGNAKYDKTVRLARRALDMMMRYAWPGNVRELQNLMERLVIVSERAAVIDEALLAPLLDLPAGRCAVSERSLQAIVAEVERRAIEGALATGGSTRRAAELLGIDQSTVVKKAKRLGLRIER